MLRNLTANRYLQTTKLLTRYINEVCRDIYFSRPTRLLKLSDHRTWYPQTRCYGPRSENRCATQYAVAYVSKFIYLFIDDIICYGTST